MFSLGYQEMVLISVIAILVVGPKRLPGFLKQAGKISVMLRRNFEEFRRELESTVPTLENPDVEVTKPVETKTKELPAQTELNKSEENQS
ncbi:MAG: twin-arginine translocase TatA/TatE family subunit [Candidatus Lindowbacteria bacterium]|nr:twin-arginine translocase TatA/TatE family subunit [Candidatus Lindowbacteria bacterium]